MSDNTALSDLTNQQSAPADAGNLQIIAAARNGHRDALLCATRRLQEILKRQWGKNFMAMKRKFDAQYQSDAAALHEAFELATKKMTEECANAMCNGGLGLCKQEVADSIEKFGQAKNKLVEGCMEAMQKHEMRRVEASGAAEGHYVSECAKWNVDCHMGGIERNEDVQLGGFVI